MCKNKGQQNWSKNECVGRKRMDGLQEIPLGDRTGTEEWFHTPQASAASADVLGTSWNILACLDTPGYMAKTRRQGDVLRSRRRGSRRHGWTSRIHLVTLHPWSRIPWHICIYDSTNRYVCNSICMYVCIYIYITLISPVISLKLPGGVCTPCFLQTGQSQKVAFGCLWHLGFQGPGQNQNKLSKLHPLLPFCSANPSNQQTPPGIAQESNASAQWNSAGPRKKQALAHEVTVDEEKVELPPLAHKTPMSLCGPSDHAKLNVLLSGSWASQNTRSGSSSYKVH